MPRFPELEADICDKGQTVSNANWLGAERANAPPVTLAAVMNRIVCP